MQNEAVKAKIPAADLLVKCLENEGVKYMFGLPGEENLALLDAVRRSSIRFITTRHEQASVFMAATMGRLTGKACVALSTLGPGATNLVTGVAYAQLGGMPLLVITGQKPVRRSKQGKFQIIDTVRMMEPITKYSATIPSAERVPSMVLESIRLAEGERPGAVHLEFPEDIAAEMTSASVIKTEKVRRPGPDPKAIENAARAIERAKHPLIIIAAGANRKLVRKQLKNFLDKTKIPFITTQMGKGVEDESSPLYIGTTALSANDYAHRAIEHADLVITVGHDITEKPPSILTPEKHVVVHVNFSPADIDTVYVPTHEVVGDVSHALWMLSETVRPQASWNFDYFFRVKNAFEKSLHTPALDARFPLRPARVVADIRAALPHDGIVSLDNGMYKIWIARNYMAHEQGSVLLDNALATMGAGLPAGIAAKLLYPAKKVLVVAGDGGIMMNISELETAQRLGIDLVVLILNDSGFGMIRWKQEDMQLPDFGLSFGNPDFVKLAESFGAKGYRLKSTDELRATLKQTLDSKGVHIIDCPIDYSENGEALGAALRKELEAI